MSASICASGEGIGLFGPTGERLAKRTAGRSQPMIQDPQLNEYRRLIPIEMLVGHFAVLKLDEAHES